MIHLSTLRMAIFKMKDEDDNKYGYYWDCRMEQTF